MLGRQNHHLRARGERAKRASLEEDSSDATSTAKLTRPFRLARSFRSFRSFRSSFIKNAHNLASLGAGSNLKRNSLDGRRSLPLQFKNRNFRNRQPPLSNRGHPNRFPHCPNHPKWSLDGQRQANNGLRSEPPRARPRHGENNLDRVDGERYINSEEVSEENTNSVF